MKQMNSTGTGFVGSENRNLLNRFKATVKSKRDNVL